MAPAGKIVSTGTELGNRTAHLDGTTTAGRVQSGQIFSARACIGLTFLFCISRTVWHFDG